LSNKATNSVDFYFAEMKHTTYHFPRREGQKGRHRTNGYSPSLPRVVLSITRFTSLLKALLAGMETGA
jgi:hypothetical protein